MTMPGTETEQAPPETPEATSSVPATAALEPAPKPGKRSLADLLADVDEDKRTVIEGEIQKARNEARNLRERLKEADPARAKADLLGEISKALGLTEDQPDPAALTQQLTASTAAARQAQIELAVYRAAPDLEGNPARLLDSRSFMNDIANVDPADANAVQEAIRTALEANPDLKVTPARRLPAPNPAQGSSAAGSPDLESQITAAQKAGDWKTVVALQNQKFAAQKTR